MFHVFFLGFVLSKYILTPAAGRLNVRFLCSSHFLQDDDILGCINRWVLSSPCTNESGVMVHTDRYYCSAMKSYFMYFGGGVKAWMEPPSIK